MALKNVMIKRSKKPSGMMYIEVFIDATTISFLSDRQFIHYMVDVLMFDPDEVCVILDRLYEGSDLMSLKVAA